MLPEKKEHIRLLETKPRNSVVCTACGEPVSPNTIFCPNCGPPVLPDEHPEFELSEGQTLARILILLLIFSAFAVYKMDVNFSAYFKASSAPSAQKGSENLPQDDDFRVHHFINVEWANVREKGNMKSKVALVLKKGSEVKVLETVNNWSKIKYKKKIGWVYSSLLTSKIK